MHAEGKTDQAKSDLARLAKIRAEREAAAAKRKAEADGMSLCILTDSVWLIISIAKAADAKKKEAAARAKRS